MKKVYCRPGGVIEYFTPNDYIASACKSGEVYKFKCDAGKPNGSYDVVVGTRRNYRNLTPDDNILDKGWFHPCEATHDASTQDEFIAGYLVNDNGQDLLIGISSWTPVVIWTDGGTNVHCTTNLERETWEVSRS